MTTGIRQPSLRDRVTTYGGELAVQAREAYDRKSYIEARTLWKAASGLSAVLGLGELPPLGEAAPPAVQVPTYDVLITSGVPMGGGYEAEYPEILPPSVR